MANFLNRALEYLETALGHARSAVHPSRPWIARARALGSSRRVRKIGAIVVAVVLFLGPALYLAAPPVLRHVLTGPVASRARANSAYSASRSMPTTQSHPSSTAPIISLPEPAK